ncbi:MAG: diguanylate cyclase response regulator [Candidatus Accumulibacter sp.]|nr:diguanylate cyclase response regulator [Accumulibacter sp.]MBA4094328.1 diguanylate cyclase response regulator [Accumulibacter sp.]
MKILLVEDTRAVAAVMAARLGTFGYEVRIAGNGQIAFDMYCEAPPDLVLMDIEMPVMNGFEATNRIRAFEATRKWAWTPIIFLTASDTPENLVTAIEAGGDDFLAKGIPESVLQAKMTALARIAALRQRLAVANRKLEEMASRDGLTGLRNRRYMDLDTDLAWVEAVRLGQPFALLMLDVDNFKKYNDRYGHLSGDDCLCAIAAALGAAVDASNGAGQSAGAFAARYGGEEFAVVIPEASDAGYRALAARCVDAVRELAIPHELNADWGVVTVSVGGARSDPASGAILALFRAADEQLYRAKENGRNRAELG